MKKLTNEIEIPLDFIRSNLALYIYGNRKETLYDIGK